MEKFNPVDLGESDNQVNQIYWKLYYVRKIIHPQKLQNLLNNYYTLYPVVPILKNSIK